ncbi:MAG: hypothetical protein V1850_07725 [Candidatus Bathyarchaeota archaeon]
MHTRLYTVSSREIGIPQTGHLLIVELAFKLCVIRPLQLITAKSDINYEKPINHQETFIDTAELRFFSGVSVHNSTGISIMIGLYPALITEGNSERMLNLVGRVRGMRGIQQVRAMFMPL